MSYLDGIDGEDRTIDDPYQGVETYFCPVIHMSYIVDPDGDFIILVGDNDFTNIEMRLEVSELVRIGWTIPRPTTSQEGRSSK